MAIDMKELIADGLLELCSEKKLNKISVTDLRRKLGISRQSFYNHFCDKEDLIQYIYCSKIVDNWDADDPDMDFYDSVVIGLERYSQYHSFLKQALAIQGQNCLKDFVLEHCKAFDYQWHIRHNMGKHFSPEQKFAIEYHSLATMSVKIEWVLKDMPLPIKELASQIVCLREVGLVPLLYGHTGPINPYKHKLH